MKDTQILTLFIIQQTGYILAITEELAKERSIRTGEDAVKVIDEISKSAKDFSLKQCETLDILKSLNEAEIEAAIKRLFE